MRSLTRLLLLGIALLLTPLVASSQCTFTYDSTAMTMTLTANCTTTSTILIPNGYTLEGAGHTITAADPSNGHFLGAVVMNGGATAHVTNLSITTSTLANVCDIGANRLRGILFEGASGEILGNTVTNINQGQSGCQEGNAIEVRNAPFDTTGTDIHVTISDNTVANYQKTGIVTNGSVRATITNNTVMGLGPVAYIAQNGIQIGFGATAVVSGNTVSGNYYTLDGWISCGLLFYDADGVKAMRNFVSGGNQRPIGNFGKGGGDVFPFPHPVKD